MKRVLPTSFACVLALGLLGCSAAPRVVASNEDASSAPLTARDIAILAASDNAGGDAAISGDTSGGGGDSGGGGFALGAGDSLGQHVFSHAVALARAENPATGWRYADASTSNSGFTSGGGSGGGGEGDRAIYAPFLGVEHPLDTHDTFETVWIFTSLLRSQERARGTGNIQNATVTDRPAPVIVLVPEN